MSLSVWISFCIAGLLISLSPGPGAVFAMASGARRGYVQSLPGIVGMQFGIALQLLVVSVGLGAALAASRTAFDVVKWFGVIYLVWLGWVQFSENKNTAGTAAANAVGEARQSNVFLQGFLVNASNPKATIFLLAVVPQFINSAVPLPEQYAVIMATLTVIDLFIMSGYVLLASRVLRLLREPRHARWINRGFGALFIAAGITLANWKRSP